MNCRDARRQLFEALDGGPAPDSHLQSCEGCRAVYDSMRRVDELLRAEPMVQPPPDLAARVTAAVAPPRSKTSTTRELLKIAAAIVVALGITAATYSTLESELKSKAPVVESGFKSVVDLVELKIEEARKP